MINKKKYLLLLVVILIGMIGSSCQKISEISKPIGAQLYSAICDGNLERVKEVVDMGADINSMGTGILSNSNPLKVAMENSHPQIVEYLLQKGADPNYIDKDGISLLMYAAGAQKKGINKTNIISDNNCKMLIKYGADVNMTGNLGYSALEYAIRDYKSDKIINTLLEHGIKIRPITLNIALTSYNEGYGENWIAKKILENLKKQGTKYEIDSALEAAILGDSRKINELISTNKIKNEHMQQILFYAAAYCSNETLQLLLEKGLDIRSVDYKMNTLLILAAQSGNFQNVKYLLEKGLNIEAKNYWNKTALMKAVNYNQYDIAEYLLKNGAKSDIQDNDYKDAFCYAAGIGNIEMIKLFIKYDYPLNNEKVFSAMQAAVDNSQVNSLQYFLDSGYNFNIEPQQSTILENAILSANLNLVEFLVEHGADVNGGKVKGNPLCTASTFCHTDIADYLIKKGADVNNIPKYEDGSIGSTALTEAIHSGSFDIVKLLVEHGADLDYIDDGFTALQHAENSSSKRIYEYVKQKSETVDLSSLQDQNSLQISSDYLSTTSYSSISNSVQNSYVNTGNSYINIESALAESSDQAVSSRGSENEMTDKQIIEDHFGVTLSDNQKIITGTISKTRSYKSGEDTITETVCAAKILISTEDIENFVKGLPKTYSQQKIIVEQIPYINNSGRNNSALVFIADSGNNEAYIYLFILVIQRFDIIGKCGFYYEKYLVTASQFWLCFPCVV